MEKSEHISSIFYAASVIEDIELFIDLESVLSSFNSKQKQLQATLIFT